MEQWRRILGGHYAISDEGRIMRLSRGMGARPGRMLSPIQNRDGYVVVNLKVHGKQKICRVHRLVGEAFLPNPKNKPQINHKNNDRQDNRASNLEWVTNLENASHASDNRLLVHGSAHASTKLKEDDVRDIRQRYQNGETLQSLSRAYEITLGSLSPMVRGKTWKHVAGAAPAKREPRAKLTEDQVLLIRQEYKEGVKQADLCRKYGISKGTMSELVRGKIWQNI